MNLYDSISMFSSALKLFWFSFFNLIIIGIGTSVICTSLYFSLMVNWLIKRILCKREFSVKMSFLMNIVKLGT